MLIWRMSGWRPGGTRKLLGLYEKHLTPFSPRRVHLTQQDDYHIELPVLYDPRCYPTARPRVYTKPAKQIYLESTSDATIMVDPDDVLPFAIDPLVQSPQSAARAKRPLPRQPREYGSIEFLTVMSD